MNISKPKILFVYDHKYPDLWRDGLWGALNVLEDDFEIYRHNLQEKVDHLENIEFDFVLGWGGFNSPVDHILRENCKAKKGLCIAGNAFQPKGGYDVLFYETDWTRNHLNLTTYPNIVKAFGVNTDIYFEEKNIPMPIVWDYIGVGAFADWKCWDKMLGKTGIRIVVGEYQENNEDESSRIVKTLLKGGVMTSPMVNPYDLANFYRWSRTAYIPATIYGGGERAILEARACGLSVEIEDNPKLKELVDLEKIPTHFDYAEKLKKGILSVIK